jgi:oxalate decarboxylase/phosphoglucose isomerase-like protein (cupin superfamily)
MDTPIADHGSPLIDLDPDYGDSTAFMRNLGVLGYVGLLRFNAGASRSSHWHRTDHHYLYVIDGKMNYYWRAVGDDGKPHHVEVEAGQMVFTPPRVEHWTHFPRESTLISVSKLRREHGTHEADLVRIAWFR